MREKRPLDYATPPEEPPTVKAEWDFWILIGLIAVLVGIVVLMVLG